MTAQKFKKFGFETDFVELAMREELRRRREREEALRAAEPRITPADIQKAEARAFEQGVAEGRAQGFAEAQAQFAEQLQALMQPVLNQFVAEKEQSHLLAAEKAVLMLQQMLRTLVGHAAEHYKPQVLEHLLSTTLAQAMGHSQCLLSVAPQTKDFIEEHTELHQLLSHQGVQLVADTKQPETACKITWQSGGVDTHLAQALQTFEAQLISAINGQSAQQLKAQGQPATAEQPVEQVPQAALTEVESEAEAPATLAAKDETIPEMAGSQPATEEDKPETIA